MKNEFPMKARSAAIPLLAACLLAPPALGQHVTLLEVRKDSEDDHRTTVEIVVPMELNGFDFDNPMDEEQSSLAVFSDDRDRDLLRIHEDRQGELREQGYSTQPAMSFGGVADYASNKDIKLQIAVDAAPSDGAGRLYLRGAAMLNFAGEGEAETLQVADVPVEMPYDTEGFASEIGPIIVSPDGSAEMDGVTYRKFTVTGAESSIVSADPVDGDDSAEVEFWGIADNQFVLKEVPDTISLEIRYTALRKVPVEFDLEFSVGL